MIRFCGSDGELWLAGERAPFRVGLVSEDGWVWRCPDPAVRFWVAAQVFDGAGQEVVADRVVLRSGRVDTARCLDGPLYATGLCLPLSPHSSWRVWEVVSQTVGGQRAMGAEGAAFAAGETKAVLREPMGEAGGWDRRLAVVLRQGLAAFQGLVSAEGMLAGSVTLRFQEEVAYDPV